MRSIGRKLFCRLALLLLCLSQTALAASGDTINVNNSTELEQALNSATGGELIRLASGAYASNIQNSNAFRIADRNFTNYVTITSADASDPAQFGAIIVVGSSFIRLDKLDIVDAGREGLGIFNGSHHIEALNLNIRGSNRFDRNAPHYSQATSLYGVNVNGGLGEFVGQGYPAGDVQNIRIENLDVQDIKSSGYLLFNLKNSLIKGNHCDWMASDCYKLAGVDNIDFINNFGASNIYASPTAHVDFVQGQGSVSNSRFIGNVALAGTDQHFQGLFFDDATYTNLRFENNLIHAPSIRGISVSSPKNGTASSGIVARFNTVLRPAVSPSAENSNKASLILIPDGSVNEHNIVSNITTKTALRFSGTPGKENVIAQYNKPTSSYFYNNYYLNAARGRGAVIADFTPVAGSYGETKGAFARIKQLLNTLSEPPTTPLSSVNLSSIYMLLLDE